MGEVREEGGAGELLGPTTERGALDHHILYLFQTMSCDNMCSEYRKEVRAELYIPFDIARLRSMTWIHSS